MSEAKERELVTRATEWAIYDKSSGSMSESQSIVKIEDEGAGEFVTIIQPHLTEGRIAIDPNEWRELRRLITDAMNEIQKHEETPEPEPEEPMKEHVEAPVMKTVEHWISQLPDGYRERAEKCVSEGCRRHEYSRMARALNNGISWASSEEGAPFWDQVSLHYSKGTPLPELPKSNP